MWYFVITLILGIYWICRYSFAKTLDKADEIEYQKRKNIKNDLEKRYEASYEERRLCDYKVCSVDYYDEILDKFQEDFEFVFGNEWREVLDTSFNYVLPCMPIWCTPQEAQGNCAKWVYHLLLADEGKIDLGVIGSMGGFPTGTRYDAVIQAKFVQRIETRLINAGVKGVRFVFELDKLFKDESPPLLFSDPVLISQGKFVIEATASDKDKTYRLWGKTLQDIRKQYGATSEDVRWYKRSAASKYNYDTICDKFQEDFEFVFGSNWKEVLGISSKPTYKKSSFGGGTNHPVCRLDTEWIYHLLLADKGKIDPFIIREGFHIEDVNYADMQLKFVQRIEERLIKAGVEGVRFVFRYSTSKELTNAAELTLSTSAQYLDSNIRESLYQEILNANPMEKRKGRLVIETEETGKGKVYRLW